MGPLEVLIILLFWIAPAIAVAEYAKRRGQDFWTYLVLGLIVSWPIALVVMYFELSYRERETPRIDPDPAQGVPASTQFIDDSASGQVQPALAGPSFRCELCGGEFSDNPEGLAHAATHTETPFPYARAAIKRLKPVEPARPAAEERPAGWYPAPGENDLQRYWNGEQWTGQRRNADGSPIVRQRFDVSPFGLGVAICGAALMVLASFLAAAEVPALVSEVRDNSLIQWSPGITVLLLAFALAAAGDAFLAYRNRQRTWKTIVIGAILLVAVVLIAVIDGGPLHLELISSGSEIDADPGIGIYAFGLGAALMIAGGIWIRASEPLAEAGSSGTDSRVHKHCPDCAESILAEARVCRYCGHRFEPVEAGAI